MNEKLLISLDFVLLSPTSERRYVKTMHVHGDRVTISILKSEMSEQWGISLMSSDGVFGDITRINEIGDVLNYFKNLLENAEMIPRFLN